MEFRDYYSTLGIERSASAEEIKRAYRRLARKYHPDVSKEADAEALFKEMKEAYEVLKDPEKRAAYDQFGENWQAGEDFQPPPDWQREFGFNQDGFGSSSGHAEGFGGEGFSDFFDTLFGGARGQRGSFREGFGGSGYREVRMDGEDINAQITIAIEDAYQGASRQITLEVPEADAAGRLTRKRRVLNVTIPKGIMAGQRIRLEDQGGPGLGSGARSGDLYLKIDFEPHSLYEARGRDIQITLPVTASEAALGRTVKAPTLGGAVDLKIPPGSSSGQRLRLKGRGLPGEPPGDQYVALKIVVPDQVSDKTRALYEALEQEESYDPRKLMGV